MDSDCPYDHSEIRPRCRLHWKVYVSSQEESERQRREGEGEGEGEREREREGMRGREG